jgi:hypothetical protein
MEDAGSIPDFLAEGITYRKTEIVRIRPNTGE